MRRLNILLVVMALALCVPLAVAAAPQDGSDSQYSNIRIVRLSLVQGEAQVFRPEQGEWEEARLNLPIQKSYALATGRGRAEVEFESGATARLDEFTELEFTELALVDGARVTTLRLERGSAIFYANGGRRDLFEVVAGRQRVRADRNARFRVDAGGEDLRVAVFKGEVEVESEFGLQRVAKNQGLRLTADGVAVARLGDADEFEQWAFNREEVLTASYSGSGQYVNAPFRYGIADLSNHGYWYYAPSYGYVWQPYAVGFVPYVNGRWTWVFGFGWSWVGYEPWGWLPYHYGRWAWTGYGWAWVPGHFNRWSPAHVAWVRFGDGRLGWCPLGPRDRHGRRPHNLGVGTVVWNGRNPVVRDGRHGDGLTVLAEVPTRERLEGELGFRGRNPRIDRASGGPSARTPDGSGTIAGPRSGFSGAVGGDALDARRRPSDDRIGRVPVSRGDVRFDRDEGRFVNTPVREAVQEPDTSRSGWRNTASERPRPSFSRSEDGATPGGDANRYRPGGSAGNDTLRYGNTPNRGDSRSSGFSGRTPSGAAPRYSPSRPSSQGNAPERSSAPPPRYSPPQQQRPSSPPPRTSPPPRQSSPPPVRQSPPQRPSSPPPRVQQPPRSQSPPRQSSSTKRPNNL